jgi:cytochrome c-type biogenesis protein CcmH/NrfG
MAYAIESRANSPANALRDALDLAERQIVQVDGTTIEAFLVLLDRIEQHFAELAEINTDVRPEQVRWESLLNRISSKPGPLAAAAAQAGGLANLRAKHPPAESFWWHVDAEVARRRTQTIRRTVITVSSLVVIVGALLWALNFFFPPDPRAVLLSNTDADVQRLAMEGRWAEALALVEQAQVTLPDEPELLIWEGVLAEQIGDTARAEASLAEARSLLTDNLIGYWLQLGNQRLRVGNLAGGEAAANKALALNPNEPQATFLLADVAEGRGDIPSAIAFFNQTFDLAEADNPQLAVIARVRMGNLLQRPDAFGDPTGGITVTGTMTR